MGILTRSLQFCGNPMRQCISAHGLGYEKVNLGFWCIVQSTSVTGSGSSNPDRSNCCAKKAQRLGVHREARNIRQAHSKYRTII